MITDTLRLASELAAKDLRLYFRDKVGMALGFLLPITLIVVYGAVFGGMGGDDGGGLPKQTIRVADEDQTDGSRRFLDVLRRSGMADVVTEQGGQPFTRAALEEAVRKGRAPFGLVILRGFGATLETGGPPSLEMLRDPAKEMEFRIASQALMPAVMETTGGRRAKTMPLDIVRSLVGEEAFARGNSAELEKKSSELYEAMESWTSRASDSRAAGKGDAGSMASFDFMGSMLGIKDTAVAPDRQTAGQRRKIAMLAQSVAGTAVMMLLFGLAACGGTILQERDAGTLRRLLVTPAPRGAILAGKFAFTFVIGLIQLVVMFAFGAVVFRLPILQHAGGLVLVAAATCAACTGFGIFIATVGRTQKQIEGISTLVILLMSSLGGSWWPLFITPTWMQVAGHFTINAWAMDGFLGVLAYNLSIRDILLPLGVLFGVAAVLIALSVVFFRRRFASSERG
jgi:ABC-2 type transport system permease protein